MPNPRAVPRVLHRLHFPLLLLLLCLSLSGCTPTTSSRRPSFGRTICAKLLLSAASFTATVFPTHPAWAATQYQDTTLRDQLKVIQALQVDTQKSKLDAQQEASSQAALSREGGELVLAHGVISLIPPVGTDTTAYPLGFASARDLDAALGGDKASLILTTVGRTGPPLAARRLALKGLEFPYVFDVTTADLLFPYNREIWESSKLSKDSVAVTAILDDDGLLVTPSSSSRFGFALADIKPSPSFQTRSPPSETDSDAPQRSTPPSAGVPTTLLRTEAIIQINLRGSDKAYTPEEQDLLGRIDRELAGREAR